MEREGKDPQMAEKSPGEQSAAANAVNERLLELLEQVVANQAVQATANLQDEFAERLRAAVQYRDSRDHAVSPLGYDQLQTGLRFVALSNTLGRFGSHGERDVALLPALQLDGGTLTFAPLPPDAASVILFRADGEQLGQIEVAGGDAPVIPDVPDAAWVQVNDVRGSPIRLGFPRRVPAGVPARSTAATRRSDARPTGARAT
jgi:hypothetical protein